MSFLASLALLLILGCTCEASGPFGGHGDRQFNEVILNDGMPERFGGRNLYIQEGATVDIICKQSDGGTFLYQSRRNDYVWNFIVSGAVYRVDTDIFPEERNFEQYHSFFTDGFYFSNMAKAVSTLRYTARKEDNGKVLSYWTGAAQLKLRIRPGPAPLAYKSTIVHKWRGGFVGEINIPISDYYTSWKIILKFPRKVFNLHGGHFQIANEPCLHGDDCGDDRKNTWVVYNTFANRVLNPGDHLKLTFIAHVWKKITQGVIADVDFYGYEQVFHTNAEYQSSSSDIHVNYLETLAAYMMKRKHM